MNYVEGIRYLRKLDSAEIKSNRNGAMIFSDEVELEVDST